VETHGSDRKPAFCRQERALRAKADSVLEFLTVNILAEQRRADFGRSEKSCFRAGANDHWMVDAKIRVSGRSRFARCEPHAAETPSATRLSALNKERGVAYYFRVIRKRPWIFIGRYV